VNFRTQKSDTIFYEKPGCQGNKRQKELLTQHSITYETRNMLEIPWTKELLEEFFVGLTQRQIVNEAAPKIKKGEIDLDAISKDELIAMMCSDPILIKRPLIEIGAVKICGFDLDRINSVLDSDITTQERLNTCVSATKCDTE
jgi:nitrogenase-associated protein